jgi:sorbitol-specific phosphotransferase system component IIC
MLADIMQLISIGKYQTKLFHNGKGFKGSLSTGILTIILSLLLFYYTILVFAAIF